MGGLQPVTHIRKRPAHYHRHRIIDVGGLHFLRNIDRDYAVVQELLSKEVGIQETEYAGMMHGAARYIYHVNLQNWRLTRHVWQGLNYFYTVYL